jgi:hypothetical protein
MKHLVLTLLAVALSAVLAAAQAPVRKGGLPASAVDGLPLLEPEKPFVAPCGLKQKLESNCKSGSAAAKQGPML